MPPTNEPRPTKAVRRDEARLKAAQMRKEQERKAKRNRYIAIGALVIAVLALVFIVWKIMSEQKTNESANSDVVYGNGASDLVPHVLADVSAPKPANDTGGIPVSGDGGDDVGVVGDGDVVVQIYFDFMCPVCGQFEQINGADVASLLKDGGTTIEYRPISFLDSKSSGTFYSTRAANAAAVVADQAPEHFAEFVSQMYVDQPAEGSAGRTDAEIAKIASDLGVSKSVTDAFTKTVNGSYETGTAASPTSHTGTWRTFAPWVMGATNQMQTDLGSIGTPTIIIDGKKFENWSTPGALLAAVKAAQS